MCSLVLASLSYVLFLLVESRVALSVITIDEGASLSTILSTSPTVRPIFQQNDCREDLNQQ